MNRDEIIAFLNRNPVFFLATAEDGKPHVRGMLLYRADTDGIIFHTGTMKDLHHQLLAETAVELCFNDWKENKQVRVRGKAELVDEMAIKQEIVASPGREFLKPWIDCMGIDVLSVFRITSCLATVWTMETNFAPKEFIELTC